MKLTTSIVAITIITIIGCQNNNRVISPYFDVSYFKMCDYNLLKSIDSKAGVLNCEEIKIEFDHSYTHYPFQNISENDFINCQKWIYDAAIKHNVDDGKMS
jgi:hypothetical protein